MLCPHRWRRRSRSSRPSVARRASSLSEDGTPGLYSKETCDSSNAGAPSVDRTPRSADRRRFRPSARAGLRARRPSSVVRAARTRAPRRRPSADLERACTRAEPGPGSGDEEHLDGRDNANSVPNETCALVRPHARVPEDRGDAHARHHLYRGVERASYTIERLFAERYADRSRRTPRRPSPRGRTPARPPCRRSARSGTCSFARSSRGSRGTRRGYAAASTSRPSPPGAAQRTQSSDIFQSSESITATMTTRRSRSPNALSAPDANISLTASMSLVTHRVAEATNRRLVEERELARVQEAEHAQAQIAHRARPRDLHQIHL